MLKKITIAAIMASVSLLASAQVTIGGKASVWMDNTKSGSTEATVLYTEPTSNISIKAAEQLGNGLSARAVLETSIVGNTYYGVGTQLGDRQATLGLASKLGSVDFGRNVHSQYLAVANNDAFGDLYGSIAGDVHNLRNRRLTNAAFASVNVGPLVATYDYSNRDALGHVIDSKAYSLGGSFGPVKGTVARFEDGAEKSTVYGVNAKFGPTSVFYSYSDNEGTSAKKGQLVGVSQQVKNFKVKASYGETKDSTDNIKAYALGADYALSKRTEVGIAYRNVDAAVDVRQIGVGLTHRF